MPSGRSWLDADMAMAMMWQMRGMMYVSRHERSSSCPVADMNSRKKSGIV